MVMDCGPERVGATLGVGAGIGSALGFGAALVGDSIGGPVGVGGIGVGGMSAGSLRLLFAAGGACVQPLKMMKATSRIENNNFMCRKANSTIKRR